MQDAIRKPDRVTELKSVFSRAEEGLKEGLEQGLLARLLPPNRIPKKQRNSCADLLDDIQGASKLLADSSNQTVNNLLFSRSEADQTDYARFARNIRKYFSSDEENLSSKLGEPDYLLGLAEAMQPQSGWETFETLQQDGLLPMTFSFEAVTVAYEQENGREPTPDDIVTLLLRNKDFCGMLIEESIQAAQYARDDSTKRHLVTAATHLVQYRNSDSLTELVDCFADPTDIRKWAPEGFQDEIRQLLEPIQDRVRPVFPTPKQTTSQGVTGSPQDATAWEQNKPEPSQTPGGHYTEPANSDTQQVEPNQTEPNSGANQVTTAN